MADRKTPNLSDSFQQMLSEWERGFDSLATSIMGTENFSRSMNQAQDARLGVQQAFREFMAQNLSMVNLPTREDVLNVADAVHAMDKRMARIESLLGDMNAAVGSSNSRDSEPPRTRKPPSARSGGQKDE